MTTETKEGARTYSAQVRYVRTDGSLGSVTMPVPSVGAASDACAKTVAYYVGMGYTVWVSDVVSFCAACAGTGKRNVIARGKRTARVVVCRACGGDAERVELELNPVESGNHS